MAKKTGRNEPCPCGSGKKYKRCCWVTHHSITTPPPPPPPSPADFYARNAPIFYIEDDGLDDLSNSVIDLIKEERFEEAEEVCIRLREEFPDMIDWLDRSAMVAEAKGELSRAADFYRRSADYVATHDGFDPEMGEFFREKAVTLAAASSSPATSNSPQTT